jgi:hypothetical protein
VSEKPIKVCKYSLLHHCETENPTTSMCIACVLVFADVALLDESLAEAGAELEVLTRVLQEAKFIDEKDFKKVFQARTKEKKRDYAE